MSNGSQVFQGMPLLGQGVRIGRAFTNDCEGRGGKFHGLLASLRRHEGTRDGDGTASGEFVDFFVSHEEQVNGV
jgi:hypothetical protein